jgi:WD40 repeat protein
VFSPDGKYVLTGSWDQTARLWQTETGSEVRLFEWNYGIVSAVAFSPDGRHVLTACGELIMIAPAGPGDKTARLWEAETGRQVRSFKGHTDSLTSVAFSTDGRDVLTGGGDRTARVWAARTGREVRRFKGHIGWVMSVAFSPDRRYVLTGSLDVTARLWEAATGREVRRFRAME